MFTVFTVAYAPGIASTRVWEEGHGWKDAPVGGAFLAVARWRSLGLNSIGFDQSIGSVHLLFWEVIPQAKATWEKKENRKVLSDEFKGLFGYFD